MQLPKYKVKSMEERTKYYESLKPSYDEPTIDESINISQTDDTIKKRNEVQESESTKRRAPSLNESFQEHLRANGIGYLSTLGIAVIIFFVFYFSNDMSSKIGNIDGKVETISKQNTEVQKSVENMHEDLYDLELKIKENKLKSEYLEKRVDKIENSNSK